MTALVEPSWCDRPAVQQPHWRHHPAYHRTMAELARTAPLVTPAEIGALRAVLAEASAGRRLVLQAGDCAESFHQCTEGALDAKLAVLGRLADRMRARTGTEVLRIGRIGGQFAKPRSAPTEPHDGRVIPSFRGHLINSEVPTRAARQHDPRRMLWACQAGRLATERVAAHRTETGPWTSHEALVLDYEASLVRIDPATGREYLASTHLPWIGERTRQPGNAHVRLMSTVDNPVGCKIGPGATRADVQRVCALLDPDRTPGRLVLIVRMGSDAITEALPPLVATVRDAGHPVVWLCDPMHGNTVTGAAGLKTRRLVDIVTEATRFRQILAAHGQQPAGLHLETAATDVTECVGGSVVDEHDVPARYTTLCDPRLNVEQALELLDRCLG